MTWENMTGRVRAEDCDLCEEARMTEWFHEDDDCWIAECEVCSVPMIVWRNHDPHPSDEVKAMLHERLTTIAERNFEFDKGMYIDDNMRNIPDHYHAHARSRAGFMGRGVHRRPLRTPPAD
jgi:hypothetical protein